MKIAATVLAGVMVSAPAWACGVMDHAEPRVGHTVKAPLDHISLFFSEAVVPVSSTIQVLDESGHDHAKLLVGQKPTDVLVAMVNNMSPCTYKVVWHAYWDDCGSVTPGDYKFTVEK